VTFRARRSRPYVNKLSPQHVGEMVSIGDDFTGI